MSAFPYLQRRAIEREEPPMRRETRESPVRRGEPTGWSPFLDTSGRSAVLLPACRTAGVSRATAYRHRARPRTTAQNSESATRTNKPRADETRGSPRRLTARDRMTSSPGRLPPRPTEAAEPGEDG